MSIVLDETELSQALSKLEAEIDSERLRRMEAENKIGHISSFTPSQNQNIVEYQLDIKEELDRIFHLLSGHVLIRTEEGAEIWVEPEDDRLKVFSDYGVNQLMNIIQFYVNKDTLLSNYDNETILWKVRDFGIELSDLIFNKYEYFFYYPTPEELYKRHKENARILGLDFTDDELYYKCVEWSNEELQTKVRHYTMICLMLIDTVHSTYLRALNGEERESLRKQMHISGDTNRTLNDMNVRKAGILDRFIGGVK